MCRLFGLHAGTNAVHATFWLLNAADSLAAQSHRNPDGAGIGVFDGNGDPVVDKQPLAAWQDTEFSSAAHELCSTTFVAHVRYASTGDRLLVNTHPFMQDRRLFAHNGVVQGLDALDARIALCGVAGLVKGATDSERIFALITAETRRARGDVETGLRTALTWISENVPVYSLNFVLTTGSQLWALRYPSTHELFLLKRSAGTTGTGPGLDVRSSRIRASSAHLARSESVLVATEQMDNDPDWRLLEVNALMQVDSDLTVNVVPDFLPPPRQLLRLQDLDEATAASQHPETVREGRRTGQELG